MRDLRAFNTPRLARRPTPQKPLLKLPVPMVDNASGGQFD